MDPIFLLTTLLKCPLCGLDLLYKVDALLCGSGHSFPYQDKVIDFSTAQEINDIQQRSKQSFQIEWTQYYQNLGWAPQEFAHEKHMFLSYTRSMPNFFTNKIVIDAGCGNGRYINIVNKISSPPPLLIIGIDLSDAVYVAAKNCFTSKNVVFMKMDINLLPKILKSQVDYIYSIGVLHHTPDAEKAFNNLAKCVKKDGFISLFLYGKGNQILYQVNMFLRNRFFRKWPHKYIYYLCVLMAIPCQTFKIKFFGYFIRDLITRVIYVDDDVHNLFDAYTAGWTSFYEKNEIEHWYHNMGFDHIVESHINHTSLYCIGRKLHE